MGDPGKISIVVLMHNNVPMTRRCLESLVSAVEGLEHEVLLMDNASTEDAGPLLQFSRTFEKFKYSRSEENAPFSIVNNRAARESSGRWLLFLNNDVFVKPGSILRLIHPLRSCAGIGATGGRLLFPGEDSVQHAGIGQMLWDHPSNYGVGANPEDRRVQRCCERFALSGAMLCVSREVFERIGGFDERYVWGTEDIDICLKIRSAGFRTLYCPDAVAVHRESATLKITQRWDQSGNCRLYRQSWNHLLVPAEKQYVCRMKNLGIRRVAVFGTGHAAGGLARILDENGMAIAAFTASPGFETGGEYLGRPMVPLCQLTEMHYDRLIVASQYFFQVENRIREYDPLHDPIYPLLN